MVAPMDVMDLGRMAVFADPTGAVFGVWQPKAFAGADLVNEPVSLTWNEVHTRDTDTDKAFYNSVFGWAAGKPEFEGAPDTYTVWELGGKPVGGMMEMVEGMFPPETPPHWSVCFAVADADATVAKARENGATVAAEPVDMPIGRFAALDRPAGRLVHDHAARRRLAQTGRAPPRAVQSPRAPRLRGGADVAPRHVIVDEAHRLHEGVDGGRPDEAPAAALELAGECVGLSRRRHEGASSRPASGVGLEAPHEVRDRALLGDELDRASRVVDDGFDLATMANDGSVGEQAVDVPLVEARDALRSRIRRRRAGRPRACGGSSARRGRPGSPPGSASRTAADRRRRESPIRCRGRPDTRGPSRPTSSGPRRRHRRRCRQAEPGHQSPRRTLAAGVLRTERARGVARCGAA